MNVFFIDEQSDSQNYLQLMVHTLSVVPNINIIDEKKFLKNCSNFSTLLRHQNLTTSMCDGNARRS